VAVQAVLLGFTAGNCTVFGEYTLFAFDISPTESSQKLLAVGLLIAITICHGCFRKTGILIQNVLGWVKVALIIFMVVTGLYVVTFRPEIASGPSASKHMSSWSELWTGSQWDWGVVATAIFKVTYSYAGLSNVNNVLNEVKEPVKTLKSVSLTALLTTCILYLLVNLAYFVVVPLDQIKESGELIAALFFEAIFGQGTGKTIFPLAIALSAAGNVMVIAFTLVSYLSPPPRGLSVKWALKW
jgi:amino acid transporter